MKLSKDARASLKETGITHASVVNEYIVNGYIVMVLRGRNVEGATMYTSWRDGEAAGDLKWVYERYNA